MSINAGAAATRMESTVDTQAVEQAVQNMARDSETTRAFLMNGFSSDFPEIDLLISN
jgi:hypothetical protein